MAGEMQDDENLNCAWRKVELILKIESIAKGFSEQAKPQIEERLRKQYGSRFAEARARGKAEQEAHVLAMSCLDDHAALRRDLAARFLTTEEEIAGYPSMVFLYPLFQAKLSAAVTLGIFWKQLQWRPLYHPPIEFARYSTALLALCLITTAFTLFATFTKTRETRKVLVLNALAGVSWMPFYVGLLYLLGGPRPALLTLLLFSVPTTIWLIVCRRLYRKARTNVA